MIVDSIRYWVQEMHVDGFRFDLASILSRDSSGHVMANPPVLWDIESDPALAGTKMIAEAWDAADSIRLAVLLEIAGGSGMVAFAMMCAVSSAAMKGPCSISPIACLAATKSMGTSNAKRNKV